jgi:carbon storage regulator
MLVIRRRALERFSIGEEIEVEVLAIEGNQVKLGIRAPREVAILRSEVRELGEVNRRSAQTSPGAALDRLIRKFQR